MSEYEGLFKRSYKLQGRDWVNTLTPEDKYVFIHIGLQAMDHGVLGGRARAETAVRDARGHFARADGSNKLTGIDPVKGTCEDRELWRE